MNVRIEQAKQHHFSVLRGVELASFETLRASGAVTGEPVASSDEELQHYLDAGLLYVAFNEKGSSIGYGGGYITENWMHIAEVDVHPIWQRKGIGRQLMEVLLSDGRARKLQGATLTTDRFSPFNAGFYASLGFYAVEGDACPIRLKDLLHSEKEKGLDPQRRVAMMLVF